jgi:hypothetical protein
VDPGGIEPPIPPCHGGVLPVYYGPRINKQILPISNTTNISILVLIGSIGIYWCSFPACGGAWWTVAESNRRPHPCEGYALPTELTAPIRKTQNTQCVRKSDILIVKFSEFSEYSEYILLQNTNGVNWNAVLMNFKMKMSSG